MFGNLKKKLSSAIQEGIVISESLQQHYLNRLSSTTSGGSTPTTPVSPTTSFSESLSNIAGYATDAEVPSHLNMAAGCALLAKYEQDWDEIRSVNEQNAKKADEVATQIECIEQRIVAQRTAMSDLVACLSNLPVLTEKLRASQETLRELTKLGVRVEQQLESLDDLCEECDLQEFMLQKQFELSQHKQKKMAELEMYRQKVAAEHQAKIRQHEEHLRQIQRERQAVFDDAFRGDIEEYKRRGTLTKILKEPDHAVALEEVTLEDTTDTKDALEEFLNG